MQSLAAVTISKFKELTFQSQLIHEFIGALEESADKHSPPPGIRPLKELIRFAKFHFACEEKLLRTYDSCLVESYVEARQSAFKLIDGLMAEIEQGNDIAGTLSTAVLRVIAKQLESESSITHQLYEAVSQQ